MNDPAEIIAKGDSENIISLEEHRQIRQVTGGNGPPQGPDHDWAAELEVRTRFLARNKTQGGSEIEEYFVCSKMENVINLAHNIRGNAVSMEWHDTKLFSKYNRLYLILEVLPNVSSEVQQRRLDGNESSEELGLIHEDN